MRFSTRQWLALLLMAILFVGAVIAVRNVLTGPYPGHNDFLTPWEAARSYWIDQIPVYSDASNENIQRRIYGRTIEEGEFPNYFAYPFHTVFLMWPLVHTSYDWASAAWMVVLGACLLGTLALLCSLYRWTPKPLILGLLLLWTLFFYPATRGLLLGQVSHLIFFTQILAVWALTRQHDTLAGISLAVSTMKPQMGYILIPLLLVWAIRERRLRFVGVFAAVFGGFMLASFILQPDWVSGWIGELTRYTTYTAVGSPVWVIAQYYLGLGGVGELLLGLIFYAAMLWAWYQVIVRGQRDRWLWAVMLALTVTHLVAPRTATTHFVVLGAPILFYLAQWSKTRRTWLAALVIVLLTIAPWIHFLTTVDGEFEHPATYLPLPFLTFALLWFTRQQWWGGKTVTP